MLTVALVPGTTYTFEGDKVLPSSVATVPATGTPAYLLNQIMVEKLIPKMKETAFVGKMYGTDILLPMLFRHFGKPEEGGLGEAYHVGIFGKTGSGKSFLARMICSIYGRYPEMSILGIDPTGEYVREIKKGDPLRKYLKFGDRKLSVYDVSQIALTKPEALKRILLTSDFLDRMGVRAAENQEYAARLIADFFEWTPVIITTDGRRIHSLPSANQQFVFNQLVNYVRDHVRRIYVSTPQQERVLHILETQMDHLFSLWQPIANLFAHGRKPVDKIIVDACTKREVVFIDLSQVSATGVY